MNPAIEIIGTEKCTGCFGCYNACPKKAIQMKLDRSGFLTPIIDKDLCNNCGICNKYCPVINNFTNHIINPKVFASRAKDERSLLKSSSGGVFGELAKYFLKEGGIIYGAGFDPEFNLHHLEIKKISDLPRIQGSKYIQSSIDLSYRESINNLLKNKKVLFCGTPCQIASLNLFIKKLEPSLQKNILTCDVVCHGVPSVIIFKRYINRLQKKYKSRINNISFRSKKNGWRNFSMEIRFDNLNKKYLKCHRVDPFMQEFLSNNYLRRSCYDCEFSRLPRYGDITLGDLWGAKSGFYNPKGVSFISINSKKGEETIKKLYEKGVIILKEYSLEEGIKSNPRISEYKLSKEKTRMPSFFSMYLWNYLSKTKTFFQDIFYKRF